jgi:hypothetical protein
MSLLLRVAPLALCAALYWKGFDIWFQQDDFAWLALNQGVHSARDFWRALFAPMAQGTIRPWSERAFFMGLYGLFGLDPIPFRVVVFLTQFANLLLIGDIAKRLTGSRAALFWAPSLWIVNTSLVFVMTWSSVYNQALCAFFMLLAFHCFLRERYRTQWVVFLLGFGALEVNVVYPALVFAYAFLCDRTRLKLTLPLFIPSVLFTLLHRWATASVTSGLYRLHLDSSMWGTLRIYWRLAMGPSRLEDIMLTPARLAAWGTILLTVGVAVFVAFQARRGRLAPLFCIAWFVIALMPVLPLREHISDYYLTIPSIGLAWLGSAALASTALAAPLVLIYAGTHVPVAWTATGWSHDRSWRIERMVAGVVRARELHPGKVILLQGVDDELFWQGILDRPFRVLGISDVYLAPDAERTITPHADLGRVSDYVLPAGTTLDGLAKDRLVVYSVAGERLKNITPMYEATSRLLLKAEQPRRVDVGNPLLEHLLGPTWHSREGAYRWMPKRAAVRIGGPRGPSERLYITGFIPASELAKGPLHVSVQADGRTLGRSTIEPPMERFDFDYALPGEWVGRESLELTVEVDRTFTPPGDGRELGLAFGVFEVR